MTLLGAALLLTTLAVTSPGWAAEENRIAVIFPDLAEPYRSIFTQINQGVENKLGHTVSKYPVRNDPDINLLRTSLLNQQAKVIVALGRQGMKAASAANGNLKLVVGGVLIVPDDEALRQPVVSLSPDPALLFSQMKTLMPATKRIWVIYNPQTSDWIVKLAVAAAKDQGLELVTHPVSDIQSAMQRYQEFFASADARRDALWLPHDTTSVEEGSLVPMILKESWARNIAVFSSNAAHVRRGVLFSLYPDNFALGKRLAGFAQNILSSGDYERRGRLPLVDVQSTVNLRTAKHLELDAERILRFDTIFQEQ